MAEETVGVKEEVGEEAVGVASMVAWAVETMGGPGVVEKEKGKEAGMKEEVAEEMGEAVVETVYWCNHSLRLDT